MYWYQFLACFFAGAFSANFFPHFVNGISGRSFPTPFADPPGKGLSSPTVNIYWSLFNLAIGLWLIRVGEVSLSSGFQLTAFFVGFAIVAIKLSEAFSKKD